MSDFNDTAIATGAIASFNNGADDVPTKSLIVTIPPTLTGVSSVTETQTGKNILNTSAFETYSNWRTDLAPNGSYPTGNANRGFEISVKSGATYAVSFGMDAETFPTYLYLCRTDGTTSERLIYFSGANFSLDSGTFTAQSGWTYYFRLGNTGSEANFNTQIAKLSFEQIELGSTVTTYSPYNGTQYTANLGRTIYGGSADIITGEGVETHQEIDLGSLTWVYVSAQNRFYANLHLVGIYTNFPTNANEIADITCADYETITFSSLAGDSSLNNKVAGVFTDAPFITIRDTRFSNANDFKNAVTGKKAVIPLATPTDFTFDGQEVPTKLGYNAFWSDCGDTEVTYYKDGYGYTSVTVNQKNGNDELIATKTAKLHRIIYEGEVDVISGTGSISIGESGTEYDPPQEFTFPPISIETVEGTNVLYANEGDSTITYRKSAD